MPHLKLDFWLEGCTARVWCDCGARFEALVEWTVKDSAPLPEELAIAMWKRHVRIGHGSGLAHAAVSP